MSWRRLPPTFPQLDPTVESRDQLFAPFSSASADVRPACVQVVERERTFGASAYIDRRRDTGIGTKDRWIGQFRVTPNDITPK